MSTIFTKIIEREIPGHFIYEDDVCVAIMDAFPATIGQSLIIPRKEIDYAFNLEDDEYLHLMKVAKKIATATDKALGTERTCLVVEGFEVPHVHIKLFPFAETEGASLADTLRHPDTGISHNLAEVAEKIKAEL